MAGVMIRAVHAAAAALVLGALSGVWLVSAQGVDMRPGRYEITMQIAMPGQEMQMPPRTESLCVTAEDLKDWSRNLVKTADGTTCKLAEYKPVGTRLTFVRECTSRSGERTTYTGDVTFMPPDSYRSTLKIASAGGEKSDPFARGMTMNGTAKRVGECTK